MFTPVFNPFPFFDTHLSLEAQQLSMKQNLIFSEAHILLRIFTDHSAAFMFCDDLSVFPAVSLTSFRFSIQHNYTSIRPVLPGDEFKDRF